MQLSWKDAEKSAVSAALNIAKIAFKSISLSNVDMSIFSSVKKKTLKNNKHYFFMSVNFVSTGTVLYFIPLIINIKEYAMTTMVI